MRTILSILLFTTCIFSFAQAPSEVSLIVVGEGTTKEEATNNALRSAIEQAFGVFVSANTEILNESIVRDEIATISSGNIKSFNEITYSETPSGLKNITLQAVVAVGKLIEYSQSHGSKAEFSGALFGANKRLRQSKEKNELQVLYNQLYLIHSLSSSLFDVKVNIIGSPFRGIKRHYVYDDPQNTSRGYDSSGNYDYRNVLYRSATYPREWFWPTYLKFSYSDEEEQCYYLKIQLSYYPTETCKHLFEGLQSILNQVSLTNTEKEEYSLENEPFAKVYFTQMQDAGPDGPFIAFRNIDYAAKLYSLSSTINNAFINSWQFNLNTINGAQSYYMLGSPYPNSHSDLFPINTFGLPLNSTVNIILNQSLDYQWTSDRPGTFYIDPKSSHIYQISPFEKDFKLSKDEIDNMVGRIYASRFKSLNQREKYLLVNSLYNYKYVRNISDSNYNHLYFALVPKDINDNTVLLLSDNEPGGLLTKDFMRISIKQSSKGWDCIFYSSVLEKLLDINNVKNETEPFYSFSFNLPVSGEIIETITGVEVEKREDAMTPVEIMELRAD